jgi:hypothetical protein
MRLSVETKLYFIVLYFKETKMAILNAAVQTTDTTILTVPAGKKYAITTLLVCNVGIDDGTGTKADRNLVLNNLSVSAADTFTFNVERLILEENDRVVLVGQSPTNLSATISYLEV